jgi:hypothetical protein
MKWFLIKMLFCKTGLKRTLRKLTFQQIVEYKDKAVIEENFELASLLSHYLEFKKHKIEQDLNTEVVNN